MDSAAWRRKGWCLMSLAMLAMLTLRQGIAAEPKPPTVDADGTVHAPAFLLPLSRYMSDEARRALIDGATQARSGSLDWNTATVEEVRKSHDDGLAATVARARSLYPVDVEDRSIANVRTRVVIPKQKIPREHIGRILLNLHGGGFFTGANAEALVESIPIAVVAATKVITIDYRQGPEYKFPAASDDVTAVYRELLKQYRASNIGVYGCSAGGALTAMAVAGLQKMGVPRPGAIGIFSSGAYGGWNRDPLAKGTWGGDSRYWGDPLLGQPGLPVKWAAAPVQPTFMTAYLDGVDLADPLVSPGESPSTLAKFPLTLLITGTRAYDMSAVVETHRQLIKNGAEADLHLWDGMNHCFFFDVDLPESKEAYAVIARFFDKHLGKK